MARRGASAVGLDIAQDGWAQSAAQHRNLCICEPYLGCRRRLLGSGECWAVRPALRTRTCMPAGQVTTRHRIQHLHAALMAPCPCDAHAGNSSLFGHDMVRAVAPGGSVLRCIFVWSSTKRTADALTRPVLLIAGLASAGDGRRRALPEYTGERGTPACAVACALTGLIRCVRVPGTPASPGTR